MQSTMNLDLPDAQKAIAAALDEAARLGRSMAFAVADSAGELIACARMTGADARIQRHAIRKGIIYLTDRLRIPILMLNGDNHGKRTWKIRPRREWRGDEGGRWAIQRQAHAAVCRRSRHYRRCCRHSPSSNTSTRRIRLFSARRVSISCCRSSRTFGRPASSCGDGGSAASEDWGSLILMVLSHFRENKTKDSV